MISNKHFNIIVALFMVIALCFSSLIMLLPKSSTSSTSIEQPDYITTIFNDDSVIEINIEMDEDSWQEMLDNAASEEYTAANITVNGTTYNNVAIRPKGNSSLSQLVTDDSTERYSFKIKLDKYVDGQTLDGLSKLVLNNNMSDTTSMKEYLSYKLLDSLGIPTPACSYAHITVNGEEWGLYLAVEPIEEEFIERIIHYFEERELQPRTLGVTDYDMDAPLTAIRRLMLESNGLVTIAFRRSLIKQGTGKPISDIGEEEYDLSNKWLTSPYCQIEPAMAFQLGLPVLILREKGVIAEGILEKGVLGVYMPEFDLNWNLDDYFKSKEWIQIIQKWEGYVRKVVDNKGKPPMPY